MPPGVDELSRAIGALEASVANLTKMVDEERDAASRHRQALRETIAALSEAVRALTAKVEMIEPLASEYREHRDQMRGAAKFGKLIVGAWVAVSGLVASGLTYLLTHHWKPIIVGLIILATLGGAAAWSHEAPSGWLYPPECCSHKDCFELDAKQVRETQDGYDVKGIELVPYQRARKSPDGLYHICLSTGWPKIRCFFAPPKFM